MNLNYFRYAWRALRKTPGLTLVMVLIFGVAVGATTVSFSVVKAVILDALPYPDSDRLVLLWETNQALGLDYDSPSPANFLDWRDEAEGFTGVATLWYETATLQMKNGADEVPVAKVSEDFFEVFGTPAAVGRLPTKAELEEEERVIVVSDRFYNARLGGEPSALGTELVLEGENWEVIGVMPPEFAFPDADAEIWRPWSMLRHYATRGGPPRDSRWLPVVARLAPGFTIETAEADLATVAAELSRDYPDTNEGWGVAVTSLHEDTVGDSRQTLLVLFAAVSLVLLIACANISSLLQVRALGRQNETAIRQAMGATTGELVRLSVAEGVLLGLLGGVLGIALSYFGLQALLAFQPGNLPRVEEVSIDGGVLLFALAVSLAAGVLFGLMPFIQRSTLALARQLTAGGGRGATASRSSQRLRRAFTLGEVVLAAVLLVGAGLLLRSFVKLQAVDPGFESESLLSFSVRLGPKYSPKMPEIPAIDFFQELTGKLEALPGVKSAAAATVLPMNSVGADFDRPWWLPGAKPDDGKVPETGIRMATPGFFETMGMELRGREFNEGDIMGGLPVVVINETLGRKAFGDADPLDRNIVIDYLQRQESYRIVGVVKDVRSYGLRSDPVNESYLPHAQVPYLKMNVVARTDGDPAALVPLARNILFEMDPAQPAYNVRTMESRVSDSVSRDRFAMGLLGFLAAVALVLSALGVYGLQAFSVRQRTKEIGVRIALGASRQSIIRSVLSESLKLTAVGVALGLVLAFLGARLMSSLLFGVEATDPLTFVAVIVVLAVTSLAAAYLPARRATRVDVVQALTPS